MDDVGVRFVLLQGGRAHGDAGTPLLARGDLRVIPGGPESDVHAAIEEAVKAAQRMRAEIEARIARALEEDFH